MVHAGQALGASIPLFSIIVAVYNDWAILKGCLLSLAQQTKNPRFEVVILMELRTRNQKLDRIGDSFKDGVFLQPVS